MMPWYIFGISAVFLCAPAFVFGQASQSFPVTVQYGEDTNSPTVPAPLEVTPVATTQINLNWATSTDAFTGVAGYQVFRNTTQIATTSNTSLSDGGLAASTTYAYNVRAFDASGNFSSSSPVVATTTLSPPPPPPPEPTVYGNVPKPMIRNLEFDPGSHNVQVTFNTPMFTQYELRYGTTPTLDLGSVRSGTYRREHGTFLTDLEPHTTYFYEISISDRFGETAVAASGDFETDPAVVVSRPSNVGNLRTTVVGADVLLRWELPDTDNPVFVRVVRNHRFFPVDPGNGTVVYEGVAESYTDTGALRLHDEQFYTVYTFNLDDEYSSGAVAHAVRRSEQQPLLPPVLTAPATPTSTTQNASEGESVGEGRYPLPRFTDLDVIQDGERITAPADELMVEADTPFVLRLPYDTVPKNLKVILVTLGIPHTRTAQASYLMRANNEYSHYQTEVKALTASGRYPVQLTVYDVTEERLVTIGGTIVATSSVASTQWGLWYTLPYLGGMFLLGIGLGGLWWLLAWRRDRAEKQ